MRQASTLSVLLLSFLSVGPALAQIQSGPANGADESSSVTTSPEFRIRSFSPVFEESNSGFLAPGEDPQNRLGRPFLEHLAADQKRFWTSPKELKTGGLRTFLPFAAFTGLLIGSDSWISKQVPDSPSQLKRSKNISDYAVFSLVGAAGGAFVLGQMKHNDHMSETGLLSGEAALNSTAITYAFKAITRRPRPFAGNGNGTFFQGGDSFSSEHTAVAWSVASVIAHEYPGPLTKLAAYGLASAVTLTRVTGKQHFASDAVVGSALGWYIGRQVYRAHHDPELGGTAWGGVFESKPESPRNPDNMGSPYVPIDSWVYPVFDRLAALGFVKSAYLGLRPWTRMECARLLEEADESIRYESMEGGEGQKLLAALAREFTDEIARMDGAANLGVSLDSVYTRVTSISGKPLQDGYHFGQTIVNDYGRPYGEGFNSVSGITAHAVAGPFSFYVRGEYQHAPSVSGLPDQARQVIQTVDGGLPAAPPGTPVPAANKMDLLEASVGVQLNNWQFTFGKQELWWGADSTGPMLFSTNAEPITMLQINRVKPFNLPSIFGRLGPMRVVYILGRLSGQHWVFSSNSGFTGSWTRPLSDQPFITGQQISFKPSPNLELGIGATVLIGGTGVPFTTHKFLQALFSTNSTNTPGSASDPGDRRGEFNFAYRIPKLRDWLTFYADAFTDDQVNPWFAWDKTALTAGLYMPQVPRIPRFDFRVEGIFTDLPGGTAVVHHGFFYINGRFRSGYTNDGNLIGSWIGRDGQGAQAWTTYWFTPKNKLQMHFRHQKVSREFIPDGGSLTDVGVSTDLWVRSSVSISSFVQYERWAFPVLAPAPQTNIIGSVQVTFWPHWRKL